jgi:P2 family phage contractile tail tube protein
VATLSITTLWNVNVMLGADNLLGRLEEFDIPQPKRLTQEYKSLAMAGRIEVPVGWDKLEARFKWTSFDADLFINTANTNQVLPISFMGDAQGISSTGLAKDVPVTGHLTGFFKDPGPLVMKAQTNFENTSVFSAWHVDLFIGNVPIYLFDALSNQFLIAGIDVLSAFRGNLGV